MPNGVASMLFSFTYPLSYRVSTIAALVAFVPRFLFSNSETIEAGEYLFGGWVSFSSVLELITLISPSISGRLDSFILNG
jgi:hypothetical protein